MSVSRHSNSAIVGSALLTVVALSLAVLISGVPSVSYAQTEDHLKCYKVKDPLRLKGDNPKTVPYWLELATSQFGTTENCKIVGGLRYVCVPTTKTINDTLQKKFVPGGVWEPLTPSTVFGPAEQDKVCYKIKCENKFPVPPNPSLTVDDQFGQRTVEQLKPFLLCGPEGERFIDNGDGTVTDNKTGLMWEKKDDSGGVHDVFNLYTWSDPNDGDSTDPDGTGFVDFLVELNNCVDDGTSPPTGVTGGFAGYCDWRLPTIVELQTIVDCGFGPPCIDPIFGLTAYYLYWSSTTYASDPNDAWSVEFSDGDLFKLDKQLDLHFRAVRGGR